MQTTSETISQKVDRAILEQGRKKTWVCEKLGISMPTLNSRMLNNDWSFSEIIALKYLLNIE